MKKVLSLLCLLALLLTAALPAFAAANIPSYTEDYYVLDEANVLEYETEGLIVMTNDLLKKACGAEVVVVAVESTNGTAIDDYTIELARAWDVGDSKKRNGFVLVLAIADDNYYAMAADGLGADLTDGKINVLLKQYLEPDFAKQNYDAGVNKVFAQIVKEISGIYNAGVTVADGQKLLDEYLADQYEETEPAAESRSSAVSDTGSRGGYSTPARTRNTGGGSGILGYIIVIAIIVIIIVLVARSRRRTRVNRGAYNPNTYGGTTYSGSGYGRGFLGGYLLGRRRPTAPPPPPQPGPTPINMGGVRPVSRPTTPTQPSARPVSRPTSTPRSSSSTGSIGSSIARGVSRSIGSFSSGRSSGAGRSSGGFRSGGFGGGRSGGGGGSGFRGGGAGRGR